MDTKKAYTFLHEAVNGALKGPGDEMAKRIYATFVTLPKPRDLDMATAIDAVALVSEERAAWVAEVELRIRVHEKLSSAVENASTADGCKVTVEQLKDLLAWNANRS
jgi:hypothetical protein